MQMYQPMPLPLDETRETVSNEPVAKLVVAQVAAPDERAPGEKQSAESATETAVASPRRHRQFTLPAWPTSQPGPEISAPSPGQKQLPTRTDQVTYYSYDQERGLPRLLPLAQIAIAVETLA